MLDSSKVDLEAVIAAIDNGINPYIVTPKGTEAGIKQEFVDNLVYVGARMAFVVHISSMVMARMMAYGEVTLRDEYLK